MVEKGLDLATAGVGVRGEGETGNIAGEMIIITQVQTF